MPDIHSPIAAPTEKYLTTKHVSDLTGVPTATLRYWRHINAGPESMVMGPARVVYKLSKLNEWLAAQETNHVRGGVAR
ncbi:DNA-binding protein [Rhodococcus sp. WS1]|uniref:helix-turn-helix transcriptional regulator n=1 Tax=unclassified Rhodococcus (in: high G+C Gram-positive bacteria) TaxID=192944 RepID=UPI001142A42A|nr:MULTISPECIES: helix-turn-helix domain-containing protein [unclassified Rhodococcus (in: high G+C Gram-positive bacteria)]ROZ53526.1 DNA-binding protein [Rhodococcus sp. WS1]TQC36768.1 DNA-binding protein [Rhodococcus sp. WS7]